MSAAMDPRDQALQEHAPAVMVPRFGDFIPLPIASPGISGHRYLVAETGLFIEVARPWLHVLWPITTDDLALPYGDLEGFTGTRMKFQWEELEQLLDCFEEDARAALPNECGAWITWRDSGGLITPNGGLEYRLLAATSASPGGVTLDLPKLSDNEHLVADVHSHGSLGAFFSTTDDQDDFGEVKYAGVLGSLDKEPEWRFRLCLPGGIFINDDEWVNH